MYFGCFKKIKTQGQEDPLEEEMAAHFSILAWKSPWMVEPGRLQSTGLQRVGHNWATQHTHKQREETHRSLLIFNFKVQTPVHWFQSACGCFLLPAWVWKALMLSRGNISLKHWSVITETASPPPWSEEVGSTALWKVQTTVSGCVTAKERHGLGGWGWGPVGD